MAHVQQWLQWQATTLSHSAGEVMQETVYARSSAERRTRRSYAAGMEKVRADLDVLEKSLAGKEYLCGKLTVADFSRRAPACSRARRWASIWMPTRT